MFCYPAWAIGSYSSGPLAAEELSHQEFFTVQNCHPLTRPCLWTSHDVEDPEDVDEAVLDGGVAGDAGDGEDVGLGRDSTDIQDLGRAIRTSLGTSSGAISLLGSYQTRHV